MTFRDLLHEQLRQAREAAEAGDLRGEHELGNWWRSRAADLERYLADLEPESPPALVSHKVVDQPPPELTGTAVDG